MRVSQLNKYSRKTRGGGDYLLGALGSLCIYLFNGLGHQNSLYLKMCANGPL